MRNQSLFVNDTASKDPLTLVTNKELGASIVRLKMFNEKTEEVTYCTLGYSDFHNLMGFTSKKMPNNILYNVC